MKYLFRCDVCQKGYTRKNDLERHLSINQCEPDLEYVFPCTLCEKQFTLKRTLQRHIVAIHEQNLNLNHSFQCNVCRKGFSRQDHLGEHALIHERDPPKYPFRCEMCNETFTNTSGLRVHNRMTHGRDLKFKDQFRRDSRRCGDRQKEKKSRHRNIFTHECSSNSKTPFQCELCEKLLKKGRLKQHILWKIFSSIADRK